jgi:hypothetical protein
VVERSDTTGRLLPPTLHPEGVPATILIHPARLYFGLRKMEYEIGPVISQDILSGLKPLVKNPGFPRGKLGGEHECRKVVMGGMSAAAF